jgi:hypothetical protein
VFTANSSENMRLDEVKERQAIALAAIKIDDMTEPTGFAVMLVILAETPRTESAHRHVEVVSRFDEWIRRRSPDAINVRFAQSVCPPLGTIA